MLDLEALLGQRRFLPDMRPRAITAAIISLRLTGDPLKLQENICIMMVSDGTNEQLPILDQVFIE